MHLVHLAIDVIWAQKYNAKFWSNNISACTICHADVRMIYAFSHLNVS